ncbi:T-box transcription factor T-like isoform X1 [Sycon ciliatum]|uniref:T-box transcription factor T-like isoform X1 n=1 Tax=Sycon ciliatum TaxID=27933 RepID=UPI0031F69259
MLQDTGSRPPCTDSSSMTRDLSPNPSSSSSASPAASGASPLVRVKKESSSSISNGACSGTFQTEVSSALHSAAMVPQSDSFPGSQQDGDVTVQLENNDLWQSFARCINEMIVTRSGRRMFPIYSVSVKGLNPSAMYSVYLDFEVVGQQRWKFVNRKWVSGGRADPPIQSRYKHPDSPHYGSHWMAKPIQFGKVKLTNKNNSEQQVVLNSLHNYEPCLHIVPEPGHSQGCRAAKASFPQTQFIAVTAYQNEAITELKISHNPFAKSFKDNAGRCKDEAVQRSDESTGQMMSNQWAQPVLDAADMNCDQFAAQSSTIACPMKTEPNTGGPATTAHPLSPLSYYSTPPFSPESGSTGSNEMVSSISAGLGDGYTVRTARAMSLPATHRPHLSPRRPSTEELAPLHQQLGASLNMPGQRQEYAQPALASRGFLAPPTYHLGRVYGSPIQSPSLVHSSIDSPRGRHRSKSSPSVTPMQRTHPYRTNNLVMDPASLSSSPLSLSPLIGSPESASPLVSSQHQFRFQPSPSEALNNSMDSDSGSAHASLSNLSAMMDDSSMSPSEPASFLKHQQPQQQQASLLPQANPAAFLHNSALLTGPGDFLTTTAASVSAMPPQVSFANAQLPTGVTPLPDWWQTVAPAVTDGTLPNLQCLDFGNA